MTERDWIVAGTQLRIEIGDFDAADAWVFSVQQAKPDLELTWTLEGEESGDGPSPYARIVVTSDALEAGVGVFSASQGSMETSIVTPPGEQRKYESVSDQRTERDVPPFLLSRKDFATAAAEGRVSLQPLWDSPDRDDFVVEGRESFDLPRTGGTSTAVSVLRLVGQESGATLVLDDAVWPLVLLREECGGDNVMQIVAIS
jgi:hypothetical protein